MAGGTLQNQQNAIQQLTGLQRYNPMQTPTSSGQGAFNYQRPTQQTYQPYLTGTYASRNPTTQASQAQQSPLAYLYEMLYGGNGTASGTAGVDAGIGAPNADSGVSASDAPGSAPGGTDGVGGPGSPGGW